MIWIILCAIVFIGGIIISILSEDSDTVGVAIAVNIFFIFISVIIPICISHEYTYSKFISRKAKIEILEKNITNIKNARYENTTSGKEIIQGSIENTNQSTNVSEYITLVVTLKSEYNSDLVYIQTRKKSLISFLFGSSIYVSNRVNELKVME